MRREKRKDGDDELKKKEVKKRRIETKRKGRRGRR